MELPQQRCLLSRGKPAVMTLDIGVKGGRGCTLTSYVYAKDDVPQTHQAQGLTLGAFHGRSGLSLVTRKLC